MFWFVSALVTVTFWSTLVANKVNKKLSNKFIEIVVKTLFILFLLHDIIFDTLNVPPR